MIYTTYRDLAEAIEEPSRAGRHKEAMELLESGAKTLPGHELEANFFLLQIARLRLYARCAMFEESFQIMRDLVGRGMPCGSWMFDRLPFKDEERVARLREENRLLIAKAQESVTMHFEVHLPPGHDPQKPYPLFLALHGDGVCNIREFSEYWTPDAFLKQGFVFVYVQSSQVRCHDGLGWLENPEVARKDIRTCYDTVCAGHRIDPGQVFVGGYSGGAITSLDIAMSRTIPVKGFVALCPEIRPASFTEENARRAAENGVRGVFLEGEMVLPVADEEDMIRMLGEAGLPLLSIINRGVGHEAPPDFDEKMHQALAFIRQA